MWSNDYRLFKGLLGLNYIQAIQNSFKERLHVGHKLVTQMQGRSSWSTERVLWAWCYIRMTVLSINFLNGSLQSKAYIIGHIESIHRWSLQDFAILSRNTVLDQGLHWCKFSSCSRLRQDVTSSLDSRCLNAFVYQPIKCCLRTVIGRCNISEVNRFHDKKPLYQQLHYLPSKKYSIRNSICMNFGINPFLRQLVRNWMSNNKTLFFIINRP